MSVNLTPDTTAAPFVQVDVTPPGGAEFVTVWRTAGGREFKVRGLVNVVADGASARDYEVPIGTEASYRPQYFDADGEFVAWGTPVTVTIPAEPDSYAWVHNPLDPSTSVRVVMRGNAANKLSRPLNTQTFRVPGRSAAVALVGTRSGLQSVVLDCETDTLIDADRFDALFGGYDDDATVPILCWRTNPAMRLPPTLFALIVDPQQIPHTQFGHEFVDWKLSGDEVSPPAEALVVALLDYADFTAFYATYAAFTAAYTDYTEASRDYSIAGTA